MRKLYIDIETFCETDLKKCGLYKYAEKVQIDLFSYAYDAEKVITIDLARDEEIPQQVLDDLLNPDIYKSAFNAVFEIACIESYFKMRLDYRQWHCTMVRSGMCGLPMDLENAAAVLGVANQKDTNGKALIRYFAMPCKPTVVNNKRNRNRPSHSPEKWEQYKKYNALDVDAERDVSNALSFYPIQVCEHNYWILDLIMAKRGVYVDKPFIENAINMDQVFRNRLLQEATDITGLSNPNSVAQLKEWLSVEMDEEITSLSKTVLPTLLENAGSEEVKRIITIRQDLAKTSVKKYHTMIQALGADGRLRGLIQYYGASRTGRAAGRLVQVHNLPRGKFKNIELPRKIVGYGDAEFMEMLYGAIPDALSSLLRSAFIASPGYDLFVSDYKAIEACVLAWLAGEQWRIDVFNKKVDIYKASSAMIFKLKIEDINDELRQRGKVAELALGYGGGVFALTAMDTSGKLKESEKQPLVDGWREANKNITKYWKTVETAAKHAIEHGGKTTISHGISFEFKKGYLFITLPSGRKLSYAKATLKPGKKWGTRIVYWGMHQTKKKWWEMETYGGKLVENIVQAVARDCLYYGAMNVYKAGYNLVMHVHDEIATESKIGNIDELNAIFSQPAPWAKGLPLSAEGFKSQFYKK